MGLLLRRILRRELEPQRELFENGSPAQAALVRRGEVTPLELVDASGNPAGIEATIGRIVKRLDALPIDAIGKRVDAALGSLRAGHPEAHLGR